MSKQHADELRRKAEQQLAAHDRRIATLERADLASLAHELAVHQIELEIQNEELRRSRALAEEARDRYLDLYDFAPVGYFTLDEHGRIVEANLTGCRLLGAEKQNLLNTRFTKSIQEEDADLFFFHRRNVLEHGARQTCELKMHAADGAVFDARLESIRVGAGRLRVAVSDTTTRKQVEETLRESEDRYRAFFESSIDAVLITAPDGTIESANAEACRMFGKTEEEIIRGGRDGGVDLSDPRLPGALEERARTGKFKGELRFRREDGAFFPGEISTALFQDRQGRIKTAMSIRDISERKRAEETLRDWNATLESKVAERTAEVERRARQLQKLMLELSLSEDRERRRIAQILHDDLQQILAAAKFRLSLLNNRAAQDPERQAIVAEVGEMLKDAIAKSRSLSHELSPVVAHRNDLAETLVWLAGQVQEKHGLTVQVDAPEVMELQSEAIVVFFLRAAQEMLFNVIKHAGVDEARIRVRRRGRCICMSVSDRGHGFDAGRQKETEGFGLFSVRERVELLGGRLKIRSRPGEGSTFYIVVRDGEVLETGAGELGGIGVFGGGD